eukprot:6297-Lingulodinium_polyedra.AAC.1
MQVGRDASGEGGRCWRWRSPGRARQGQRHPAGAPRGPGDPGAPGLPACVRQRADHGRPAAA